MAEKKYVSLTRLSNFLDNIKTRYSQIGHKHTKSDITDFPTILTYSLSKSGSEIVLTDSNGDTTSVIDSDTKTTVDSVLSSTSTNPVQNKIINSALSEKVPISRTVNGKALSADISITSDDVGADPAGSANTALSESNLYTDNKISNMVGTSSVATQIDSHNSSTAAHSDIRNLITDLTAKLNNFLDVDDTTTDQLSEVLTLINNNKGTIESLTTNKINVSDIVDNLTTSSTSKVLSAKQGVIIKGLIDDLQDALNNHTHSVLTLQGNGTTLTNGTYDGSVAKTINITPSSIGAAPQENGQYAVTTAGTGAAYTATVTGIFALSAGVSFIMIPHTVSTTTAPTLDVNGLGAKTIKRRLSNNSTSLQSGYSASWLALNKPFRVTYDGTYWIVEGHEKPVAADMYGLSASITELNYCDGVTSNIQTQLNNKSTLYVKTGTIAAGSTSASISINSSSDYIVAVNCDIGGEHILCDWTNNGNGTITVSIAESITSVINIVVICLQV